MGDKNSFILYTDLRDSLTPMTDEEVGKLIRAVFDYVDYGVIPDFDGSVMMAFHFLRTTLDRDAAKWEKTRAARSEAGQKGADARWGKTDGKNSK